MFENFLRMASLAAFVASASACNDPNSGVDADARQAWTPTYTVARGDDVWLGGTPDAAALAAARANGVRVAVDLRGHEEKSGSVASETARLGITLHSVPFKRGEPFTAEAVDAVAAVVAGAEASEVLVFCASGQRAAAWWAAQLIRHHDVDRERALARAKRAGLSHAPTFAALEEFAREEDARREARGLAEALTATLMKKLGAALDQGGVESAARVCAGSAADIAAASSNRKGVVVRRTALRWRNPDNRPNSEEERWLTEAEAAIAAGRPVAPTYRIERTAGAPKTLQYLSPIVFPGGLCSQCHGTADEIPAGVQAFLEERYPEDRATGFLPGELRGAISITLPLE